MQKDFIELTLKANGKADLYFHAYFWHTFAVALFQRANHSSPDTYDTLMVSKSIELQRLKGLADFLRKVHANIAKNVFSKDVYDRYVNEFGGRK